MEAAFSDETDEILKKLLKNRGFQDIWIKRVEKAKRLIDEENIDQFGNEAEQNTSDKLVLALNDLTSALQVSIETFRKSADLAFGHCLPVVNRDASDAYPIKFQVERLITSSQLDVEKFCLVTRRLLQLLKSFNRRLSTPPQLANLTQFAGTICDLMYQLEKWLTKNLNDCSNRIEALQDFREAIDLFNCTIVGELEMNFLELKLSEQDKKRSKSAHTSPLTRASIKKYRPPWECEKENKYREGGGSWIPSKELQKMRTLLKPRQAYSEPKPKQTRFPMRTIIPQTGQRCGKPKTTPKLLEEKWKPIFRASEAFQGSLGTTMECKINFKLIQEITKEVIEKLNDRN
ncbi:unnamed protein product, partial [Mesorhabditis belari]|uniref:Uncharacterized protein n=1 Tax=Mesorhabditis belari TaxID=2138241 RepID=A0AAF3E990_9BILA